MRPQSVRWLALSCTAGLLLQLGCATQVRRSTRLAPKTEYARAEAGLTPEQIAFIEDNCGPFGAPALDPAWPHAPTSLVVREGYVLRHSCLDKVALWVCEHVEPDELEGDAERDDRFREDPQLAEECRSGTSDYRRSGFDRGHQAPAGNQKASQRLNDETFFLSNMAPQEPGHNRQVWRELEALTREWVADGVASSAWVLTGGLFWEDEEDDPDRADGLIEYRIIGDGEVGVPTHFYKIVLARADEEDGEGSWRVVAFVLENRKYERPYDFAATIRSIDWIEARTGLDFFPDLVDPLLEPELEGDEGSLWREDS